MGDLTISQRCAGFGDSPEAKEGLKVVLQGAPASHAKSGGTGASPLKLQVATSPLLAQESRAPSGDTQFEGGSMRLNEQFAREDWVAFGAG